jgi:hypothetical protein
MGRDDARSSLARRSGQAADHNKPNTTFGNVKADVLADKNPHFHRGNFCSVIRGSRWKS